MRCDSRLRIFAAKHSALSQVLSGKRPFYEVSQLMVEFVVVSQGRRPRRPSFAVIPDRIWEMLQACWSRDPTQRPTVEQILVLCMVHAPQDAQEFPSVLQVTPLAASDPDAFTLRCSSPTSWLRVEGDGHPEKNRGKRGPRASLEAQGSGR